MKMLGTLTSAVVLTLALVAGATAGEVKGKEVSYQDGKLTMKGYLATPAEKGKFPGVLVVHEWWGHNEYTRKRARMLAEMGYVALAVDMYGDGKQAVHPDDAGKFASEVMKNQELMQSRFNAALAFLKKQPEVDTSRIAAIGYCFGGAVVLNMARQGGDLKGVASFHGSLVTTTPAKKGAVKAKVAVFKGDADVMIPPAQVEAFKKEMADAGVDLEFVGYPGVKHSFTNPDADDYAKRFNLPLAYDAKADKDSWDKLGLFLKRVFAQ